MTTTLSDLTEDLVSEILSRVPITSLGSVRSTWKALSRYRIFGKLANNQFLGFVVNRLRICSVRIDLQGISCDGDDFIDVSINQVTVPVLNHIQVSKAYHCDGLLLCFPTDHSSLLVWNPYLGQTKSIPHKVDPFHRFALGYDNNRNHKILEIFGSGYNIYDFSSNSWRLLDVISNWKITTYPHSGVTLKGNAYFYVLEEDVNMEGEVTEKKDFLLCFDFTSERFGPHLSLPRHYSVDDIVNLSCVRDEKLAVFYQSGSTRDIIEIWVTNNIGYNELSWTKCWEVKMRPLTGFPINKQGGSFFIDEEEKVAVVFDLDSSQIYENGLYQNAHIIGQDGYFNSITVGGAADRDSFGFRMYPLLCSSYVPNLVQID